MSDVFAINVNQMSELSERLIAICEEYTVGEVSTVALPLMLTAVRRNEIASEQLLALEIIMRQVSSEHNLLLHAMKNLTPGNLH